MSEIIAIAQISKIKFKAIINTISIESLNLFIFDTVLFLFFKYKTKKIIGTQAQSNKEVT